MTRPLASNDPLASLFVPAPPAPAIPLRYRSGLVVEWDGGTCENTISVDGLQLDNVPVMPGDWNQRIDPGDSVSLLSTTDEGGLTTYVVVGLAVKPPNPKLERIPTSELVQRIDSSIFADVQNVATFLMLPTFVCMFRPGWAYKIDVQMYVYGLSASNFAFCNLYLGSPGLSGTPVYSWRWQNPSTINKLCVQKWTGHVRNTGGSPVSTYVSAATSAEVNIGVGVASSSAFVPFVEVTPAGPAGKFENAVEVF